ncbi:Uncharacterised protein [Halioglobus japonicus]|nr:Uncharacterised protein [Halioglobus japonicus]
MNNTTDSSPASAHRALDQFLVLLALTGFTITEPVLTIFGVNPEIFYFYNIDTTAQIVLYALVVALLPALCLWLLTVIAAAANKTAAAALYHLFVLGLGALWVVQLGKWSLGIDHTWLLAAFAAAGAGAFILAYRKWAFVSALLRIAAIAPVIAVGVFLSSSDTANAMRHVAISIPATTTDRELPSVVFILLDEFPLMALMDDQGNVDESLFPNLAALAGQATWYRHYTALSDVTQFSVPSILTGDKPRRRTPSMADFPNNLFSLLAPTHHMTVFETLTKLCGFKECGTSPPGVTVEKPAPKMTALLSKSAALWMTRVSLSKYAGNAMDDFKEETRVKVNAHAKPAKKVTGALPPILDPVNQIGLARAEPKRLLEYIETFTPGDHTALYYIHLQMPHIPWRYYGNGQMYEAPAAMQPITPQNDDGGEWLSTLYEYRFFMQAQHTDRLVGKIVERLQELGMWDDSLVVVTADHGRSFKPNTPTRWLSPESIDTIAYVPLFIKAPAQTHGVIDDSNMMAYDLLPTLADILQIDIPFKVGGLAAGHPDISRRGDQKTFYPIFINRGTWKAPTLQKPQQFSDTEHFPEYASRGIKSRKNNSDSLRLLNDRLGLNQFLGRAPAEFDVARGGRAHVEELNKLQRPAPSEPPLGVVMGELEFTPAAGSKVLIAINERFVTASPLVSFKGSEQTFFAMLPSGVLGSDNAIDVFLVEDMRLYQLEVE